MMNAARSMCGWTAPMPARLAVDRSRRWAARPSRRLPLWRSRIGPDVRSPMARSMVRAVRGTSGMTAGLLPLAHDSKGAVAPLDEVLDVGRAFSQSFDRLVARSALSRIRLHDLRHTHASILLKAGVPVKVVSERLGHANPAFTITVYQHIIPGMQADAATVFSDLVAGVLPPAVRVSEVVDDE
jgi:integrase